MQYRKLGRTGLDVGIIGLGAEHLEHEPQAVVRSVVDEATDQGVNYIDLFMASPGVRDNFGAALKGRRDRVMVAGHLGAAMRDGQYHRTREKAVCEEYFHDLIMRLQTDYIDILMLHFIDEPDDLHQVFNESGILELALKLKKEGKARYIGLSSHKVPVSIEAVNSGFVDVLMFPVNPAFDMLPGDTELEALWKEDPYGASGAEDRQPQYARKELYRTCEQQGVGIVAMKPYAAGWLFWKENPSSIVLTPEQCLHYTLSQPGVCTAVPGCKTVEQMRAALAYFNASDKDRDYSTAISQSRWDLKGNCMYCNHCLPCPQGIDIAAINRLIDSAESGMTNTIKAKYAALDNTASSCIQCGRCMEQCPFGVDVIGNMVRGTALFG